MDIGLRTPIPEEGDHRKTGRQKPEGMGPAGQPKMGVQEIRQDAADADDQKGPIRKDPLLVAQQGEQVEAAGTSAVFDICPPF